MSIASQLNTPSHLPESVAVWPLQSDSHTVYYISQDKTPAEVLTNYLEMIGISEMQLSEVFKM